MNAEKPPGVRATGGSATGRRGTPIEPQSSAVGELFSLLGYTPEERLAVCHQAAGGDNFTGRIVPALAAEVVTEARAWAPTCDVWWSVNPTSPPDGYRGRGTAAHVTRWAGLYADLDVKDGGLPSLDAARAVIEELSSQLGTRPVAVIHSGHGLQPVWALAPEDDATDLAGNPGRRPAARALARRWGRLVSHVAGRIVPERHRGHVDSVFDLARVLRVPGTWNRKPDAATGELGVIPTWVELRDGAPVLVDTLTETLTAAGIEELGGDRDDSGEVVSDPNGWGWATEGCRYAAKTINAWAGDEPKKGRHPWLINCAVRLAALHRWGCLTEELHERAVEVLHDRVRRLCEEGIGGPVRAVAAGELADALAWGRAKAASKADEALTSELGASGGCHKPHRDQLPADAHPAGGASEGWRGSQATGEPTEEELTQARRDVLTHADQAAVIARDVLGDRWLWSKTLGWQQWDGKRWADRTEESVVKVVSGWLRRMVHREAEWADNTRRNQLYALLRGSSIEPIVRLCRAEVEVHDVAAVFDAHPDLLNCANGVLDLRTGELGPHDPKLHMRKIAPVEYHPEAVGRPELAAVLDCVPDPAVREWLQLIFGQALTGHPQPDPVVPILQGGGRNGKSTLITAIRNAFGPDYGVLVDDRVLLSGADSAHSTERMDLLGTRFALVEELPGGRELNTTKIKKITGTDAIKARRMHRDPVEFRATHALVLTTNFTPVIREVDEGSWRRIAAVPFPVRYRPEGTDLVQPFDRREDQKVYTAVRAQDSQVIESVLAWLVEGARRWYADGRIMPKRPAAVEALTQSWRGANDVLGEFIAESLEADRSRFVLGTELYAHYEEWCRQGGHPTRPVNQIKPELLAHPLVDGWGLHDDRATPTEMVNLSRPVRLGNVRLPTTRQRVIRGLRFRSEARPATGNDDVPTQEVIHLDARRK